MTMQARLKEIARPVFIVDAEGFLLNIDRDLGVQISMDLSHWQGKRGNLYSVSYKSPDAAPIADNANLDVLLITDPTQSAHVSFLSSCGGDSEVAFYEDTVVSSNGTQLPVVSINRVSSLPTQTTAYRDPTITGVGSLLFNDFNPGGTGIAAIGGTVGTPVDWLLRPGTNYLMRNTNRSGAAEAMSWVVLWHEDPV